MKVYHSLIALFFVTGLFAQPVTQVTYETKLRVADERAKAGDYYNAIEWFDKAYDESRDVNLQVAIADLYMRARDYKRAEQTYVRVLKRDKDGEFNDIRPSLGDAYKYQGKYQEALEQYNLVLNNAETPDSIKKVVTLQKEGIDMLDKYENNLEVGVGLVEGKVNSGSAESSPAIGPDGQLYYSSYNSRKEIILDGKEGDYEAKLYAATLNDKGEYDKTQALAEAINRPGFHSGGVSFSADGRKMYFTRAQMEANGIETSRVYVSYFRDRAWGAAQDVAALNGPFLNKHPMEGELFGKKVLYFSSDRPGGEGGFDLYYADINGDEFGAPVNLGPVLNTSKDEISPFYKDGTLYYSTDGRAGLGGYDVFYSTWSGTAWSAPENMGFQYNSSYDDMFLRFDPSGTRGFLVSNRPFKGKIKMKTSETCCDDIYGFAIKELVVDLFTQVADDKGALEGATVEVYDLTLGGYPDSKTNPKASEYSFQLEPEREYRVIVSKDGFYPDTASFNTRGIIDDYTVRKKFTLKTKPEDSDVTIVETNQPIRLNNIYFDLDKADILPDAEQDLTYLAELMEEYPTMVIELGSHTDAQGQDAYNVKLSQRRAESSKDWLVKEGIDDKRIVAKGYGETQILNRCKNGVRCSDDEHRQNRRTEFKIISGPTSIKIKKSNFDNGEGGGNEVTPPASGSGGRSNSVTPPANKPAPATSTTTKPATSTPATTGNTKPVTTSPTAADSTKTAPAATTPRPSRSTKGSQNDQTKETEARPSRSTKGSQSKEPETKERKRKKRKD